MIKGDNVYYYSQDGDTVPTQIIEMSNDGKRCKVFNLFNKTVWVNVGNCELQEKEESKIKFKIETEECCSCSSYKHQTPMPIKARVRYVDYCIADIVAALNAANITTLASCCGHSKVNGTILLEDGRIVEIYNVKKRHKEGSNGWQQIINEIGAKKYNEI
jgi:hypothetical protein